MEEIQGTPTTTDNNNLNKHRSKQGYQRDNGRWEARYRPQCRFELPEDEVTKAAFKGCKNGLFKYEFLDYFDTVEEKDVWLNKMKADFSRRKHEAICGGLSFNNTTTEDVVSGFTMKRNLEHQSSSIMEMPSLPTQSTMHSEVESLNEEQNSSDAAHCIDNENKSLCNRANQRQGSRHHTNNKRRRKKMPEVTPQPSINSFSNGDLIVELIRRAPYQLPPPLSPATTTTTTDIAVNNPSNNSVGEEDTNTTAPEVAAINSPVTVDLHDDQKSSCCEEDQQQQSNSKTLSSRSTTPSTTFSKGRHCHMIWVCDTCHFCSKSTILSSHSSAATV